jgi:hypothetical protein
MSDEREAYRHCGMNPTNNAGPELGFPGKNWDISGFKARSPAASRPAHAQ